jgi:type 1 glutamine amidotransferase
MFLIGEAEYASQVSMPPLIREFEERCHWRTTTCPSDPIEDGRDVYEFVGMESLADVDVLVVFTRFRRLSGRQMEMLLRYVEEGRPVVALRTSTHSFDFPEGSPYRRYNDEFGEMLFGTPWRYHHGHSSRTDVEVVAGKEGHPILKDVEAAFSVRSWLYHVLPLPETCDFLLEGTAVDTEIEDPKRIRRNPVAWTNVHRGGRVFYTSLGHPEDFQSASFRNLVMNGILWAGAAEREETT